MALTLSYTPYIYRLLDRGRNAFGWAQWKLSHDNGHPFYSFNSLLESLLTTIRTKFLACVELTYVFRVGNLQWTFSSHNITFKMFSAAFVPPWNRFAWPLNLSTLIVECCAVPFSKLKCTTYSYPVIFILSGGMVNWEVVNCLSLQ